MVNLAGAQLDYCVFQCFTTSMSALDICHVFKETIAALSLFHFRIIAVIGDGAQCNRQFQKRYFIDTIGIQNGRSIGNFMTHPVYKKPIFYISDPSHMVKKIVSSLSSNYRNIYKFVNGKNNQLSLSNMMHLWTSFNGAGLNEQKDFKTIDFVKNSFQAMMVGPCIKVINIF